MTAVLSFTVGGVPAPQGSKTAMPNGALVEAGSAVGRAKVRAWRQDVHAAAVHAMRDRATFQAPVALHVTFIMPRPKSRKRDVWHATKPDLDKLIRATADALTSAGVLRDDSLICSVKAAKRYTDEHHQWSTGALITVEVA